jgi:hypothetical protein
VLPAGAAQGGHQRRHRHDRRHDGAEVFVEALREMMAGLQIYI